MLWKSTLGLLALAELSAAVPSPYWAKQHILEQAPLKPNGPYHPGHRDQYDHKIDAGEFHDDTPNPWQSQHQHVRRRSRQGTNSSPHVYPTRIHDRLQFKLSTLTLS